MSPQRQNLAKTSNPEFQANDSIFIFIIFEEIGDFCPLLHMREGL